MKYRAIAEKEWEGRPLQGMGNCLGKMREWARAAADRSGGAVRIYESGETLVDTVQPVEPASVKTA